jgi:hypothetical protein
MHRIYFKIPKQGRSNLEIAMPKFEHVVKPTILKKKKAKINAVLDEIKKATTHEDIFNQLNKLLQICNSLKDNPDKII